MHGASSTAQARNSDSLPLLTEAVIGALAAGLLALSVATLSLSVARRAAGPMTPVERRIDPNVADADTLALLPGVGPALAGRIVAERRRAGPFRSPDDLARVPGIGPRTVRTLRERLRFDDADLAAEDRSVPRTP